MANESSNHQYQLEVKETRKSKEEEVNKKLSKLNEEEKNEINECKRSGNGTQVTRKKVSSGVINMGKQFEEFYEHCERKELFEVAQNKGDEGLAVVDFQAGVFEAMRSLMMSLLMKHYNAVVFNEPVIEVMGPESKEVETRVMIDISVTLREKEHKMKIKV